MRTFNNETSKFENRFGKIRDEENIFAVKKLMLEGLLRFRFRRTTLNHEQRLIALENTTVEKASTAPTTRQNKFDTCAPIKIRMASKDYIESS